MPKRLAELCKSKRIEKDLSRGQLAKLIGYKNLSKGGGLIYAFEQTGFIREDLLPKLVEALELDPATVETLAAQDRQEYLEGWEKWVNEPVPMRMVVRLMAAIYCDSSIPKQITTPDAAEEYVRNFARKNRVQICLVVSRRLSVWFDVQGRVMGRTTATPDGGPNEPWSYIC